MSSKSYKIIPMDRDTIIKNFATNLRVERVRKQIKQEKLAEMADITPEYLARVEAGKYSPSLVVIVKLALALDVSIDKLITY
jgi:transcriptional regulator with XRE-family HTH domain